MTLSPYRATPRPTAVPPWRRARPGPPRRTLRAPLVRSTPWPRAVPGDVRPLPSTGPGGSSSQSLLRPGRPTCPQTCGWSCVRRPRVDGDLRVTRTGDLGRLIEELSPGMCTAWGDLRPSAHTGSRPAQTDDGSPRPCDSRSRAADLHVCPSALVGSPAAVRRRRRAGYGLGTEPGRSRGQDVDGRRPVCTTVEMSTCRQQPAVVHPQRANMSTSGLTCENGLDPQVPHQ
jgi:hypothetical protein